ncbi:MAG: DUF5615 family PIN-like protein [Alphaproteobacteria bacterium]
MKIRADEHVSPEIVHAICKIAISSGFELTSIFTSGDRGTSDTHWVSKFGREGGIAILTADTDFLKRPHQVMAIREAGLIIVHLPSKWANAPIHLQASHILAWWRRIEHSIANGKPGDCWQPEWNVNETGKLKQIPIDYEEFRKKLKKANRPSRRG